MRATSSIRFKTLRITVVIIVVLLGSISYFALAYLSRQFQEIEDSRVKDNLEQVVDTYQFNLDNISLKLTDWSAWDDTYEFIEDKNPEYISSNLLIGALSDLRLNYIVFVDIDAQIVASLGVELGENKEVDIPGGLAALIYPGSEIITHQEVFGEKKGILNLEEGILMFASRPIVTSRKEGPIKGTLIFARYLDKDELTLLSNVVHFPIETEKIDDSLPSDYKTAYEKLNIPENYYLHIVDKSTVHGYSKINDFFAKPAFLVRITYPRDITQQGTSSIRFFILAFLISAIVGLGLLLIFLDRFLINRVEN